MVAWSVNSTTRIAASAELLFSAKILNEILFVDPWVISTITGTILFSSSFRQVTAASS